MPQGPNDSVPRLGVVGRLDRGHPWALLEAMRRRFGVGMAAGAPSRLTKKTSGNVGNWPNGANGGNTQGRGLLQLSLLLQLRQEELKGARVGSLPQPFPYIVDLRASPQAALY